MKKIFQKFKNLNFFLFFLLLIFFLGIGIVYALPPFDVIKFTGEGYKLTNITCPYLINVSEEEVKDECTGLIWKNKDESGGPFTWDEAKNKCPLNYRLPTIDELYSLVNPVSPDPNTNTNINRSLLISPPLIALGTYWSSTPFSDNTSGSLCEGGHCSGSTNKSCQIINDCPQGESCVPPKCARSVNFHNGTADNIIYGINVKLNVHCVSTKFCGNGTIDPGEECEGTNLNNQTCQSKGFLGGNLGCQNCQFETSGCFSTKIVPTEAGKSCAEVCGSLNLTCKSIGTNKGYCSLNTTKECRSNSDCSSGETCRIGGAEPLNLNYKYFIMQSSGANWVCHEVEGNGCQDIMTGSGWNGCQADPEKPTPWTYCQCGT